MQLSKGWSWKPLKIKASGAHNTIKLKCFCDVRLSKSLNRAQDSTSAHLMTEAILENTKGFRDALHSPTSTGGGSALWQISAGCYQGRQTPSHLYGESKDLKSFQMGWRVSNRSLERDSTWRWSSSTFLVCDEKSWPQGFLTPEKGKSFPLYNLLL